MTGPTDPPATVVTRRLGYLLKHAQLRFATLNAEALAPFGIGGRECAVMFAIDEASPLSQKDLALRMSVDRTTMLQLVDELEHKGLATRTHDPQDRRRNIVALTASGRALLSKAGKATEQAERRFLDELSDDDEAHLRRVLHTLVHPATSDSAVSEGRRSP